MMKTRSEYILEFGRSEEVIVPEIALEIPMLGRTPEFADAIEGYLEKDCYDAMRVVSGIVEERGLRDLISHIDVEAPGYLHDKYLFRLELTCDGEPDTAAHDAIVEGLAGSKIPCTLRYREWAEREGRERTFAF
jgi:hypothetical protein